MVTAGPVAESQLQVFYATVWVTAIIFVVVAAVLTYATIKFKARTTDDENAPPPEQSHGNPLIELSLIGVSVLALVFIAFPTLRAIWFTYDVPEEERENAYVIDAIGYQWWFKFDYPMEQIDGVGALSVANEMVIPAGRPVRVNLRTVDVIHSFWVPKLNETDFAEWVAHKKLPARTVTPEIADPARAERPQITFASFKRNEYGFSDKWDPRSQVSPLDNWRQQQFPHEGEDAALIAQGRKLFQTKTCIACHTVRGHEGMGITGPELTHIASQTTIAAGLLENTPEQMARWIMHPEVVKPGNKMYTTGYVPSEITIDQDEALALVAYLQSLK